MRNLAKTLLISVILLAVILNVPRAASSPDCGLLPQPVSNVISTSEPWYCPINQQIYSEWVSYLPAAAIVIFISFAIAGIIFMIGVAFNSNKIRNFGIGEFYEAIATLIIVMAFLYICAVVFGILPGVLVGGINPYATAFNLMSKTINTAQNMYSAMFNIYLSLSSAVSPRITLEIAGSTSGIAKSLLNFIGFAPQLFVNLYTIPVTIFFLDPSIAIANLLADGIAALYAEYYLLTFFSIAAIPAFLIPGVFFRSIFPTRALGGILIAMAFGFYLVMPALFSVAYYFTAPTVQRDMGLATLQMLRLSYSPQSATSATSPLVLQLDNVKSSLNGFWLLIFFYPSLIIAITYATIQELANFIGRASQVSGRVRSFI